MARLLIPQKGSRTERLTPKDRKVTVTDIVLTILLSPVICMATLL